VAIVGLLSACALLYDKEGIPVKGEMKMVEVIAVHSGFARLPHPA
jgi:hypothetical protein